MPGRSTSDSSQSWGDLGELSNQIRFHILVPSGGWLGDVVALLSSYTGIWVAFFLIILFISAWVVLRTSPVEVALVLSHVFDLTIPLQHHLSENKDVRALHANHLDQYWPFFLFGTGVQVGAFFLVHPELFTLIVCFKTTVLTVLWLGRKQNGQFWTSSIGRKSKAHSSPSSSSSRSNGSSSRLDPTAKDGKKDKETAGKDRETERNRDEKKDKQDKEDKAKAEKQGQAKKDKATREEEKAAKEKQRQAEKAKEKAEKEARKAAERKAKEEQKKKEAEEKAAEQGRKKTEERKLENPLGEGHEAATAPEEEYASRWPRRPRGLDGTRLEQDVPVVPRRSGKYAPDGTAGSEEGYTSRTPRRPRGMDDVVMPA
ncbi:hypothetical protein JCM24511_05067 [Saitozyma sp. JCM 24511]|nr:hypothetical protein JCM24511_05067 [Saitozyma sp. JCM 24511]